MSGKDVYTYSGESVDVTWDRRLCIHVGECTRATGALFQRGRDPWGQPDLLPAGEVVDVVGRCPTGAIVAHRKDGGAAEQTPTENTVVVANCGPLYVRGDLRLMGAPDDMPGIATRVALCRCGHSKAKPFCDGAHEDARFDDRGAIGDSGTTLESTGGPLELEPLPNGPILVRGNLTLVTGHGLRTWQGDKAALSRCGQSSKKPFCDGTHKSIGFTTE